MREGKRDGFTYWKRPWDKWLILAAAILEILSLWMNLQEYNRISAAGFLSASEWADYAAQKGLQCGLNGILAASFFGIFLIGAFARSQRRARLAEGVLLLLLALAWGAVGAASHLALRNGQGFLWGLLLLLAFGAAAYKFWRYRKTG